MLTRRTAEKTQWITYAASYSEIESIAKPLRMTKPRPCRLGIEFKAILRRPRPIRVKLRGIDQVFVTEPSHEFSIPSGLGVSGSRHWRIVQLAVHAVWFVLTVEVTEGSVSFKRTACIAWDTDLVELLQSLGDAKAVGLLCMTPGWCSPTGQWAAREVCEVWEARAGNDHRTVILRDSHGHEFGDRPRVTRQQAHTNRRLILRLEPYSNCRDGAERGSGNARCQSEDSGSQGR